MRLWTWALVLALGALMVAVVLRKEPPRKRSRPTPPPPVTSTVERPMPLEPPWGPPKQPGSELPADVDDVLAHKCRRCHGVPTRNGAPFPLYTWADTRALHFGNPIYVRLGLAVQSGFMPNLVPANPPVEKLTDAEKKVLLDWVAAGAPSASFVAKGAPVRSGSPRSPKPRPTR